MSVAAPLARDVTERVGFAWARSALVALTTTAALTALRLLLPHLYGLKERTSLAVALGLALAVAASALLTVPLSRFLGYESAVVASVSVLAGWRVLVQLPDDVSVLAAVIGAVLGLGALTLLLSGPEHEPVALGVGLFTGFALDAMVLAVAATWEPAWQRGVLPFAVSVLVAAGLLVSLGSHLREVRAETACTHVAIGGGLAFGGVFALELLFLANPAFVAAAAGVDLAWAVVVVTAGLVLALAALALLDPRPRAPAVGGAAALAVAGFVLPVAAGWVVPTLVLLGQVGAGLVLTRALAPAPSSEGGAEAAVAVGLFIGLVGVLVFQLHYDMPLPVDNRVVTAGLGLLTVAGIVRHRPPVRGRGAHEGLAAAAVVGVAGLAVAVGLGVTAPAPATAAMPASLRVVQWNVRQAVADDGTLDPAALARSIAAYDPAPDVVVLNEVGRGFVVSGQLDLATWLARRLDLHMAWGAAASEQFGNLVLSRFPIGPVEVIALPVAGAAQGRSLIGATIELPDGSAVRVLATHLQHRNDPPSLEARLAEVDRIIDHWNGSAHTILAGDLNPMQGDPPEYPPRVPSEFVEIRALLDAGFTTAGELDACTRPTTARNCSDFILVSPDLGQRSFEVADLFGDHRLLVTDVHLG
jgi:endonuclease/exonuclease/phosphatase family metal-dependent hydrolase